LSAEPITPVRWAGLVGLLVLILVAGTALFRTATNPPPPSTAESGRLVADFTLPDVNGRAVNLREYVNGRPFVFSFGSTSCPGCIMQLAAFKELRQKYGDQVAILEINVGAEPPSRVAAHMKRMESPFTTLIDTYGSVFLQYGTGAIPVTVVADSEGRIITVGNYIPAGRLAELLRLDETAA
jgi:peroxiredoxin